MKHHPLKTLQQIALLLVASAVLTACGGGKGGDGTPITAVTAPAVTTAEQLAAEVAKKRLAEEKAIAERQAAEAEARAAAASDAEEKAKAVALAKAAEEAAKAAREKAEALARAAAEKAAKAAAEAAEAAKVAAAAAAERAAAETQTNEKARLEAEAKIAAELAVQAALKAKELRFETIAGNMPITETDFSSVGIAQLIVNGLENYTATVDSGEEVALNIKPIMGGGKSVDGLTVEILGVDGEISPSAANMDVLLKTGLFPAGVSRKVYISIGDGSAAVKGFVVVQTLLPIDKVEKAIGPENTVIGFNDGDSIQIGGAGLSNPLELTVTKKAGENGFVVYDFSVNRDLAADEKFSVQLPDRESRAAIGEGSQRATPAALRAKKAGFTSSATLPAFTYLNERPYSNTNAHYASSSDAAIMPDDVTLGRTILVRSDYYIDPWNGNEFRLPKSGLIVDGKVIASNGKNFKVYWRDVAKLEMSLVSHGVSDTSLIKSYDWGTAVPVLFIHGFSHQAFAINNNGRAKFGGGGGTWAKFPSLAIKTNLPNANQIVPFEFRWNTNSHYESASLDLAAAINMIKGATGKNVVVVAHSFGGVLVRTLLEGMVIKSETGSEQRMISSARDNIDTVLSLGSPYGGILPANNDLGLARGRYENFAFGASKVGPCMQITCKIMGEQVSDIDLAKFGYEAHLTGVGSHVLNMQNNAPYLGKVNYHVAIGVLSNEYLLGKEREALDGDSLISFAGQRFNVFPTNAQANSARLLSDEKIGEANVTEYILGYSADVRPKSIIYVPEIKDPTSRAGGYRHADDFVVADGGWLAEEGLMAQPRKDCDIPATCTHASYQLFKSIMGDYLTLELKKADAKFKLEGKDLAVNSKYQGEDRKLLESLLAEVKSLDAVSAGAVRWDLLNTEQLNAISPLLPKSLSNSADYFSERDDVIAQTQVLNAFYEKMIKNQNKLYVWDKTTAQAMVDTLLLAGKAGINAAKFATGVDFEKVKPGQAPGLIASRLKAASKFADIASIVTACDGGVEGWRAQGDLLSRYIAGATMQEGENPIDAVKDLLTCFMTMMTANPDGSKKVQDIGKILFQTYNDADSVLAGESFIVSQLSTLELILDFAAPPVPDPVFTRLRAAVSYMNNVVDTYRINYELSLHTGNVVSLRQDEVIAVYSAQADALNLIIRQRRYADLTADAFVVIQGVNADLKISTPAPDWMVGFQVWLEGATDNVQKVVYALTDYVVEVSRKIVDTVDKAFLTTLQSAREGVQTIYAKFFDGNGQQVGSNWLGINVNNSLKSFYAQSDVSGAIVQIKDGDITEDVTPIFRGVLDKPIPAGYEVHIFHDDETESFGAAVADDGVNWVYAVPAEKALKGGRHSFTAGVVLALDGSTVGGPRTTPLTFTILAPGIGAVTPSEAIRATPLTLTFTGTDLPTTGLAVTAPGNTRNTCDAPTGNTASGFAVACTFYSVGEQVLEVRRGSTPTSALLASAKITVNSNVTNVTWSSASQAAPGKGTVKFGEMVTYQVSGTRLLTDAAMGFSVEQCGLSNTEVGSGSDALRTFQCWFNNEAGAVAGNKSLVVKDAPSGTVLYTGTVPVEVAPIDVNQSITVSWDTGAVGTSVQGRGNNPRTVAINDGVELPGFLASPAMDVDISEGKVRLSNFRGYTGAPGNAVFDASAFNGLVLRVPSGANWRFQSASVGSGNTVSGLDGSAGGTARLQNEGQFLAINLADLTYSAGSVVEVAYTRSAVAPTSTSSLPATGITANQCYGAGSSALVPCSSPAAIALSGAGKQDGMLGGALSYSPVGSYSKEECVKDNATGLIWEGKTTSGLRAGNNTYTNYGDGRSGDASAYVAAVNAQGLCGFNDWRLPTVDELQSIVDYSKAYPGPTVEATWFTNTAGTYTWSSSPGYSGYAWLVSFSGGFVNNDALYNGSGAVRLVRASQ